MQHLDYFSCVTEKVILECCIKKFNTSALKTDLHMLAKINKKITLSIRNLKYFLQLAHNLKWAVR